MCLCWFCDSSEATVCVCVCGLASHTDPELCVSSLPPLLLSAGLKPQTIPSGNKAINSQQPSRSLSHLFHFSLDLLSMSHFTCFISVCALTNILQVCVSEPRHLTVPITKNYAYSNYLISLSAVAFGPCFCFSQPSHFNV